MWLPDGEVRAMSAPWNRAVEISIRDGEMVAVDLMLEKPEVGAWIKPTIEIPAHAAQTLMDDLWNCGIRPTDGAGSAGAMARAEAHIADLRKIAFKTLGVKDA